MDGFRDICDMYQNSIFKEYFQTASFEILLR